LIEVTQLSKYYGITRAVHNLSFSVEKGEILGFLGPNGAGKTTTMKMLTGFVPPSSGRASILGFDIIDDSLEVRKRIGYLPEKNPLYHDMSVDSYLSLVARLKGIESKDTAAALERVSGRCGLTGVRRRTIGNLSKGFQQRVGIAQAIINDPELLILDEPTIGLDPQQIIEIRNLIRELGEERTVILSSHILPEVNQVCDRIIIINNGELIAVDSPENLRERLRKSSMTRVKIRASAQAGSAAEIISSMEGIVLVRRGPEQGDIIEFHVESAPDIDIREELTRTLVDGGIPILEIFNEELTLEDIFIKLVTEEEQE
jgi:ABC-2 type transport system ATP-binding protein